MESRGQCEAHHMVHECVSWGPDGHHIERGLDAARHAHFPGRLLPLVPAHVLFPAFRSRVSPPPPDINGAEKRARRCVVGSFRAVERPDRYNTRTNLLVIERCARCALAIAGWPSLMITSIILGKTFERGTLASKRSPSDVNLADGPGTRSPTSGDRKTSPSRRKLPTRPAGSISAICHARM